MTELALLARESFAYCAATGRITRRVTRGGQMAGAIVGTARTDGYQATKLAGKEILCHRLAWLIVHGDLPSGELDHINGNRSDNRIDNLRCASRSMNNQNRRTAFKSNRLGVLGVTQTKRGTFIARIRVNGKGIHLGVFPTAAEASQAYVAAKRQLHQGNTL